MLGPILNFVSSGQDTFTYDDFSKASDLIRVTVGCNNPDRMNALTAKASGANNKQKLAVSGFLQGDIDLKFDSKWDAIMGGSGSMIPSDLLNMVDLGAQVIAGQSIRQPWFARSVWRGNSPLKIPLTLHFLALDDAKTQVWDQLMNLVRLFLPRLITKGLLHDAEGGIGKAVGWLGGQLGGSGKDIGDKTAALLQQIIGTYAIPGPSVFFPLSAAQEDTMFCYIGNLAELTLSICYFTDLSIKIPTVFSQDGYPMYAEASFVVNSQDNLFIDAHGNVNNNVTTIITNEDQQAAQAGIDESNRKKAAEASAGNTYLSSARGGA